MTEGQKYILFCWAWMGLILGGISLGAGIVEPILAFMIVTAMAGPPMFYLNRLIQKETGRKNNP